MNIRAMRTRFFWAPDGGAAGSGGEAGSGAGGGAAGGGAPPAGAPPAAGTEAAGNAPARPEWCEEKFWDAKAGQVRTEDLAKSYSEIQRKMSTRNDDLAKQVRTQLEQERLSKRPASADAYLVQPPKGLLPDGVEFKPDPNNPMLKWWNKFAWENGLDQGAYEQGVATYIEALGYGLPDPAEELKKLGDNGMDRVNNAKAWTEANLSEAAQKVLASVASTADGIKVIEEIMAMTGDQKQGSGQGTAAATKTRDELEAMMKDERYYHPTKHDPAFRKQVTDGLAALGAAGLAPRRV